MKVAKVHAASYLGRTTACGLPLRWKRPDPESPGIPTKDDRPIKVSRIAVEVTCGRCWNCCD